MKFCQGTKCHQYKTKDRIKGPQENKTYQTRRRSKFSYGGNFCSLQCSNDWFNEFGNRAIDHFGRTTEAKHLTQENAWYKDYDWDYTGGDSTRTNYRFVNQLTKEQRPLTREQYNDRNYTLNVS